MRRQETRSIRLGMFAIQRCQARLAVLALALALAANVNRVRAEDRVVLAPLKAGGTPLVLRGEIVDYRGDALRFRTSGGKEDTYDPARLTELVTTWPAPFREGEARWRAGAWDEAIVKYRAAAAAESRPWAKRRMLARLVECLRDARRIGDAGDAFLGLYRADPQTPDFGVIPLDWTFDASAAAAVESRAREWFKDDATPPAVLLGASWLLGRADRPAALAALRRLSNERDPRFAHLADAQIWRTQIVSARRGDVETWQTQLDRMPESWRAGPTLVVGQAWVKLGESQPAALQLLRIPILWNDQRELAAVALWEAARVFEGAPTLGDSTALYREIVTLYPASSLAESARKKLTSSASRPAPPTGRAP